VAENALQVEIRQSAGKGAARKLRATGKIPGVCYGKGEGAVPLSLDPLALRRVLERSGAGLNTVISLAVSGGGTLDGRMVLLRELQREPVGGSFLHADFYAVDVAQKVTVKVPLHLSGKAKGIDLGGIVDHQLRELELECLPLAIPRQIEVDVSELGIGDSIHVRDLALPEGVSVLTGADVSVVSVVTPSKAEEPVAAVAPEEGAEAAAAEEGAEAAEGEEKAAPKAGEKAPRAGEKAPKAAEKGSKAAE
jgi:large subunit ribosomal protein L25